MVYEYTLSLKFPKSCIPPLTRYFGTRHILASPTTNLCVYVLIIKILIVREY